MSSVANGEKSAKAMWNSHDPASMMNRDVRRDAVDVKERRVGEMTDLDGDDGDADDDADDNAVAAV